MKTGLIAIVFSVLIIQGALAQVFVNGTDINGLDITYCQVIGFNRGLVPKHALIWIDYGQPKFVVTGFNAPAISGPDKQKIEFKTVIDALNFMTRSGWDLVSSHVMADKDGAAQEFIYLLRKREGYSVK